ncbi:hypothetical protein EW146_g9242 [Bondarzewia mesenterica]|uniref:Reverse transcriptase Ty1/copia-type domain-containing protein n=1 Tax=Bondarzewia mesenterica TaxID=1095465 RepID=A0A4V3XCY4_9AGAM|nr:hypothetical protein EW146_g9242 [Bondarzewia mesenterica]
MWEIAEAPVGANVYKARLVTQGFSQIPGVDYFDTYAPVAKLASIRTVLAIANRNDLELHQVDIKGTYLNDLMGFERCQVDQAIFYRHRGTALMIVVIHVDDYTIAVTIISLIDNFKAQLHQHVEVTDLGTIHLSQQSYIDSIMCRFNFDELKPTSMPMETHVRLSTSQSPSSTTKIAAMCDVPYREAVGAMQWAALTTRPDISFSVSTVSRFSTNPGLVHWEAVKQIFRYLKAMRDLWLSYGGEEKEMVGYADADESMVEDCKAVSGYAFIIDGGAISWSSKKQEIVSLSTTESEYVAATHAMKEALWLCSLITEILAPLTNSTTLFSDNQSAIALMKDHQ